MNEKEIVKKNLNRSIIINQILGVLYTLILVSLVLLLIFYKRYIDALKGEVSENFINLFNTDTILGLVLLYFLSGLLTIPFIIQSFFQGFTTRNFLINKFDELNKDNIIYVIRNFFTFAEFNVGYILAVIIVYVTLKIGNILFLIIPISITLPCLILGFIFKYKAFKVATLPLKRR